MSIGRPAEKLEDGGKGGCVMMDLGDFLHWLISHWFLEHNMGAYKYIGELYKKKQSDVLRFLLRVR